MPLPDLLPIPPFTRPVRGSVALPGSKSLTNRALLLAALGTEPVRLTGALFSEDTHLMAAALRQLGFTVEADEGERLVQVGGQGQAFPGGTVQLEVGLAGTAARFLTALCAAAPRGVYRLDGVPQMRRRPMQPLLAALRALGAEIRCTGEEGFFPLEIHARGLRGGEVTIDPAESSQLLSALLMVAPLAAAPVTISLSGPLRWPFVEMTTRLMAEFGQRPIPRSDRGVFHLESGRPYRREGGRFEIEPDATAASYFLALPLVAGGVLRLPGLRAPGEGLQGDTAFLHVLERLGLKAVSSGPRGIEVWRDGLAPGAGIEVDFSNFSDTFLTLAALAPLLPGPTRITGIGHTRKQETDRVAGAARELTRLGQEVIETPSSLEIHPRPLKAGTQIETYGDHRFAMSFAILGCRDLEGTGKPWLSIRQPGCCAKTYPDFFTVLAGLRAESLAP